MGPDGTASRSRSDNALPCPPDPHGIMFPSHRSQRCARGTRMAVGTQEGRCVSHPKPCEFEWCVFVIWLLMLSSCFIIFISDHQLSINVISDLKKVRSFICSSNIYIYFLLRTQRERRRRRRSVAILAQVTFQLPFPLKYVFQGPPYVPG